MQFGVREICDVVFKAKNAGNLGSFEYVAGQPVLYIDSAKTSTMEGAATTVYAQGGKGNARLIAWEGERTLTFTVEDALLSELGFAILSGAGLMKANKGVTKLVEKEVTEFVKISGGSPATGTLSQKAKRLVTTTARTEPNTISLGEDGITVTINMIESDSYDGQEDGETITYIIEAEEIDPATVKKMYVHTTATAIVDANGDINLTDALGADEKIHDNAPVFAMAMEHGSITGMIAGLTVDEATGKKLTGADTKYANKTVFVDFYVEKTEGVTELTIDMENFAGYYYVEASTLFKRQSDGKNLPAELIFPNVKIQSNFTFSMASTGDPSTFTFTMDAMPGYTRFDRKKKVLCAMQIVDETVEEGGDKTDSTTTIADGELLYPVQD